jgi:2-iminobutanoate/2-iminopropanoate deaminase
MQFIYPSEMPRPKGHYAPAVVHNDTVYVSGQLPMTPEGEVAAGGIEAQTELCLRHIETVLRAAGSDLHKVLKMNIFISDVVFWPQVNAVFARVMGEHRPARAVIPCGVLHYGCLVEIDCIAAV